jgi:hypothetical protein
MARKATRKKTVDLARIARALRLLDRHENNGRSDPEAAVALRFYRMCKKFFAQGGRFKRKYTRKKK